jgi:GDP-4-dehydro-6-deoxy-D-mannose reductase
MRTLVTGASGFVGRWLTAELGANGHSVLSLPDPPVLDVADPTGLTRWLADKVDGLDAIVHLAGIAFAPEAQRDPGEAFRVNVGGTQSLFEALRALGATPVVLVAGSSEAYGDPDPKDLPLGEAAPLAARRPYGLSKLAQEAVALEAAARYGFRVVVTRAFNHTGPRQRPVFVVPALAQRVLAVKRGEADAIPAGNLDVRRDLSDVRDVVRAYRLLVEAAAGTRLSPPVVVNVGSGTATSIRGVVEALCRLAGVEAEVRVDPSLVRPHDPPEIRADISLLTKLTGWRPEIGLETTLADILADTDRA